MGGLVWSILFPQAREIDGGRRREREVGWLVSGSFDNYYELFRDLLAEGGCGKATSDETYMKAWNVVV